MNRKSPSQPPHWFTALVGLVLPALLILIGLHDLLTGRSLLSFSSTQFRANVPSYRMEGYTAAVNGLAFLGMGLGLLLRFLVRCCWPRRAGLGQLASGLMLVSVVGFLFGVMFLPLVSVP